MNKTYFGIPFKKSMNGRIKINYCIMKEYLDRKLVKQRISINR